jgi:hypothetical protein
MQRRLSYSMSGKEAARLARSLGRYAYRSRLRQMGVGSAYWWVLFVVAITVFAVYGDGLLPVVAIPEQMVATAFIFLATSAPFILLYTLRLRRLKEHANFDPAIHITQDDGGLRFATAVIEYHLKWQGIDQLRCGPDGIVVLLGGLIWLVPYTAFASAEESRAFIRDVYSRLQDKAKATSEKHIRAALIAAEPNS